MKKISGIGFIYFFSLQFAPEQLFKTSWVLAFDGADCDGGRLSGDHFNSLLFAQEICGDDEIFFIFLFFFVQLCNCATVLRLLWIRGRAVRPVMDWATPR